MLKKPSMDYILENFIEVYQQEEFLSLSVERVTEILASDHLRAPKEDIVFEAAMLWLDKCPTHRLSFEKVLEQIRLPLISPSYLHTVVECLDVVKEHQGCQRFISEAKERPYSNTARPRRTAVLVTVGRETKKKFPKVESFDPLTNQWRTLGRLPLKVEGHAVVMSGSILYLAGGHETAYRDSRAMWRYDVHHNSWLEMAPMNVPRSDFRLVILDGYVFAVSGHGGEKIKDSMERYDPNTNTWQLMESVGVAAYHNCDSRAVVSLDGLLYFIGTPLKPHTPQVAKYNPETSVWTDVTPMRIPRDCPAVCTLNGKIYVIGGRKKIGGQFPIIEKTVECFNPKTNLWTMCASMQERRYHLGVIVLDGKIYVLGGLQEGARPLQSIEHYCDQTDMWETVGQMPDDCGNNDTCMYRLPLKLRNDRTPIVDEDEYDEDEY